MLGLLQTWVRKKIINCENFKSVLDVVSNEMIFDENENVTAFTEPLIHTFTKNTQSIGDTWRKKLHERKNVLLMGKLIRA